MMFRGICSTARVPGPNPETPVKIRRVFSRRSRVNPASDAPPPCFRSPAALRPRPCAAAAGPRRLVTIVLAVAAGVFAAAGLLRVVTDGPLRADIAGTILDLLTIVPAFSPLAPVAIGVAMLIGIATLLSVRSMR